MNNESENKKLREIYQTEIIKENFKQCLKFFDNFETLIDIGCANGTFLNYIHTIYEDKKLYGLDINDFGKDKKKYKFIKKNFITDDNPIKCDIVLCFGVLSYLNNLELFIKNLLKYSNRRGKIIIFDNINFVNKDFQIKFKNNNNEYEERAYSYWYSKESFLKITEKYNLNINFTRFIMPFKIDKTDDLTRAYTKFIDDEHKQFVYNDFPLNFHFIEISYKPMLIMFHHFHNIDDDNYIKGSVSDKNFEELILKIGVDNIIDFDMWIDKYNNKTLKNEIAFSFDDGLKCQFDIALPILEKYKIKAGWSIVTSTLENKNLILEELKFIQKKFDKEECFYDKFKKIVNKSYDLIKAQNYRKEIKFYSKNEREFRYIRDNLCSNEELKKVINNFNLKIKNLFMNEDELRKIISLNHTICNHTHNHFTNFNNLSYDEIKKEIQLAKDILINYGINNNYFTVPFGFNNKYVGKICDEIGISNILGIKNFIERIDINLLVEMIK